MLDIPSVGGAASSALSAANVHPLVLFSILDHYARREGSQTRVIGEAPVTADAIVGQRLLRAPSSLCGCRRASWLRERRRR